MFVNEIYRDAQRAFEGCDEETVLKRLTYAVKLLNNTGILDCNLGEMSLCVCNGCTTLPRGVGTVLGVNVHDRPTLLQDQWFQYHINGPGSDLWTGCGPNAYELGQFCTFRDPSAACYLQAEVTSAADNNKKLRVYAIDMTGKKIFTPGPDGKMYEGFLVPMIFGFSQRNPNVPPLASIYRISKDLTKDFVRLLAVNASDGISQTLIGEYEPDETLPEYRRLKVACKSSVRIKYKKKDLELRSQRDFINCDNPQALILACRSVRYSLDDKWAAAAGAKGAAIALITEQAESQKPAGPRIPQIINGVYNDDDTMFYGPGGDGRRWG